MLTLLIGEDTFKKKEKMVHHKVTRVQDHFFKRVRVWQKAPGLLT